MGGLGLLAAQIGRRQDGLNSLGLTAAVMAWLDTNVLRDIGFQLSFTATLGLILLGNPFTEWTRSMFENRLPAEWAKRLSQPLVDYFMLTLAAQALSLPVTIYHFQRLSIAGPRGATLLLTWKSFRMLLPVGMDTAPLDSIGDGKGIGQLSALLLPGSGYAPLNPPEWAHALNPQVVLLSVSAKDTHGLPAAETLVAWEGYSLLRNDLNGWIELTTDGEQIWVEAAR